jgi:hypothetical protein
MQVNANNTVGQAQSQNANPARQARQQGAAPGNEDSPFGRMVSEIAKQSHQEIASETSGS